MCGRPTANGGRQRVRGASVLWTRGTGLSLHACVTGPRGTLATVRASDRWSLRRLGVRAWAGYGEPTWRRAGDVVRGSAGLQTQFDLTLLHSNFLQFSK
jgi:hypothetical protein